jgi:hypothetical protein
MAVLNKKNLTVKRRLFSGGIIAIMTILYLLTPCCSHKSAEEANESDLKKSSSSLTDSGKLPANQPASELERLAERSSPDYKGNDTKDAFSDILKLRDVGDANAVPVLEKIMADNLDSTRIHGYAAAQALFCINTPEAHKVLAKYLLTSRYFAELGINYAFHWQMDESRRNRFIEEYHLQNISKDLGVKLNVKTHKEAGRQQIIFTVTLHNISERLFWIIDQQVYLGNMLFFKSKSSRFARTFETVKYEMPSLKWQELAPGASHQYDITAYVRRVDELKRPYWGLSKDASIVVETRDIAYDIKEAGWFEVYAMVEARPPTKLQIEKVGSGNLWSGRVVSNPVTVEIGENVMSKIE